MYKRMIFASLLAFGVAQSSQANFFETNECSNSALAFQAIGSGSFTDTVTLTGDANTFFSPGNKKTVTLTLTPTSHSTTVNATNFTVNPISNLYSISYTASTSGGTGGSKTQSGKIYVGHFGVGNCQTVLVPNGTGFFHGFQAGTINDVNTALLVINSNLTTTAPPPANCSLANPC